MGKQKSGKKGDDVIVQVPPGTLILDADTNNLLKDFTAPDDSFIFLKGGKGGKGNMHFATSTNQAPRYAQPGLVGQDIALRIELKLIADVGLVGFPNAGKSTLLSVVSKARPKIANYPFTTLKPNLGVFLIEDESYIMADIPGIIEGASNGLGLGFDFLKHIERTKILLFFINIEEENYLEQLEKLQKELYYYSKILTKKPYLIAASKMDIENSEEKFEKLRNTLKEQVIPISSITHLGIKKLLYSLKNKIHQVEND